MLAVDHTGEVVDGDQLIAMFAADLHERGQLAGGHVVVTVLSNLGLRTALSERGVSLIETPVGDRHVADALESGGYVLGGEQSGHLIFREHASTGDGLLTSLKLLELLARDGQDLAELAGVSMQKMPQAMVNVPVQDKDRLGSAAAVWTEVAAVEAELGSTGRVILRSSGTEPAVRVMVEAPTLEEVERHVRHLAAVVERELA
jgi:phosphoglucosamine mutase